MFEVGDDNAAAAGDQPDIPQLLHHVDAETPAIAVDVDRVSEIDAPFILEDALAPLFHVDHGDDQPRHLLGVHRLATQRPQRAVDAHERRRTDLQMEVARFKLDDGPKQLLDFQLLLLAQEPLLIEFGGRRHDRGLQPVGRARIADRRTQ